MSKMICLDMDGTIADLYSVSNWLDRLRAEDPTPYLEAKPLVDMEELASVLNILSNQGWEVRVISWLSKGASKAYGAEIRRAKRKWLEDYNVPISKAHLVAYGTTKADCVRKQTSFAILFDDDERVRRGWHLGTTVNPQEEDILQYLRELVEG